MKKKREKIFNIHVFKKLLSFAKVYRWLFGTTAFVAIFLACVAAFRPFLIKQLIDNYTQYIAENTFFSKVLWIGFVLFFEVSLQLFFMYFSNWLGQTIIKDIRLKAFKHILYFEMAYFKKSSVGRLVTRVVSDVETIAQFFSQGFFMILADVLKMLVVLVMMLYLNFYLALLALLTLPLLLYVTRVFQKLIKVCFQQVRIAVANLNSFVQEHITGISVVQVFAKESQVLKSFQGFNQKHRKVHIRTVLYFSIFFPIAELLAQCSIGFLIWFGAGNMAQNQGITAGELISFIMFSEMLFRPLRQIADKFSTLQMGMVAAERVFDILEIKNEPQKKGTFKSEKLQGTILFENISFSYNFNEPILKDIYLKVNSGETIAIVGETGAGKSTLINLLAGFYEPQKGRILLDKQPLNKYHPEMISSHFAIVQQDVFLFSDSIYHNITLKDDNISLEAVKNAAKAIGIHNFIESLPCGYHYNVKERGATLSVGQRQLIAFLRAYIRNPKILILDEATASIDSNSETLIQQATKQVTKNRTAIIIAHRLATIQYSDRIIVMNQGKIVEQGNHSILIKNPKGFYHQLYYKQFEEI